MRLLRILAVLVCLGAFGCASTETRKPATAEGMDLTRREELEPGVNRGSYVDSEADFAVLKSLGVRTIVSLRGLHGDIEPERKAAASHGMTFFDTPIEALPFEPSERTVTAALDDIGNPSNQPVYFHCKLGRDRTGMVAALFRVNYEGWSPSDAYEEWRKFGFTDPFMFHGLKRYFDRHQDPVFYWKRNPTLVGLKGFHPEQSCATYANARGGKEAVCEVGGAYLTADTLLKTVAPGGKSAVTGVLQVIPPTPAETPSPTDPWAQCKQLGGHQEDLHGEQGRRVDVCRFADGSAIDPTGLAASASPDSPLVKQLTAWKTR